MITLSIILAVVITTSFFIIRNLILRNERLEDFITKQSEAIEACDNALKIDDEEQEISFIKARSYNGKQKSDIIKFDFFDFNNIKGRDIIIIEDIVDTGDTVTKIRNKMINKANSVAIAAFLLKPNKAKLNFEIDWVGFEIPDEFVVGYGLDYNQKFRNLKGIYQGIEI